MSSGTNIPFNESDREFLGRFRYAAAGFIKDLVIARLKQQPDFLSDEECQRWSIDKSSLGSESCEFRLQMVKTRLAKVLSEFVGHGDSIPSPESRQDDRLELLRENVAIFVDRAKLDTAIGEARQSDHIDWDGLARWDLLPEIRAALDDLPRPKTDPAAHGVSLSDLAKFFEGDDGAAPGLVEHWHDLKAITAKPIGRCPTDGRAMLYGLTEILADIARVNGLDLKEKETLRQHLKTKLRRPKE